MRGDNFLVKPLLIIVISLNCNFLIPSVSYSDIYSYEYCQELMNDFSSLVNSLRKSFADKNDCSIFELSVKMTLLVGGIERKCTDWLGVNQLKEILHLRKSLDAKRDIFISNCVENDFDEWERINKSLHVETCEKMEAAAAFSVLLARMKADLASDYCAANNIITDAIEIFKKCVRECGRTDLQRIINNNEKSKTEYLKMCEASKNEAEALRKLSEEIVSDSCYKLGYRYGRCGELSLKGLPCDPADDIVIPERCRNRSDTLKGITDGISSVRY